MKKFYSKKNNKLIDTVYVGIVTFNNENDIELCLNSLKIQNFNNLNILVLDNNSTDNTRKILDRYRDSIKKIYLNRNIGFGNAHNAILTRLSMKKNDWYLALNPDVILEKNYIKNLVLGLTTNNASWGTGLLLYAKPQQNIIYSAGHALFSNGYTINIQNGNPASSLLINREVFGAPGAAVLFSSKLIKELITVNGEFFDSNFFMYSEDTDIDWRARNFNFHCWFIYSAKASHKNSHPSSYFRDLSVVHRYLSVVKNSQLKDLFFFNLFLIISHLFFRTILTPKRGVRMSLLFWKLFFPTVNKRYHIQIQNNTIHKWFQSSSFETTSQPTTWKKRIKDFLNRRE